MHQVGNSYIVTSRLLSFRNKKYGVFFLKKKRLLGTGKINVRFLPSEQWSIHSPPISFLSEFMPHNKLTLQETLVLSTDFVMLIMRAAFING